MTNQELFKICIEVLEGLRQPAYIPWDTDNMATHGLQYRIEGDQFHIWMDFDEAPYVPYTNEPWTSPKWNGKKNPNEGWWQVWAETFSNRLAQKLRGKVE